MVQSFKCPNFQMIDVCCFPSFVVLILYYFFKKYIYIRNIKFQLKICETPSFWQHYVTTIEVTKTEIKVFIILNIIDIDYIQFSYRNSTKPIPYTYCKAFEKQSWFLESIWKNISMWIMSFNARPTYCKAQLIILC